MQLDRTDSNFNTTQWTLIGALRDAADTHHETAMATLCERYWPPVYAHLRRRGHRREEAAETTQAFFADVVLSRRLFEKADSSRGRLRTLIRSALANYVKDQHRRKQARGSDITIALDDLEREEGLLQQDSGKTNEDQFDKRWAHSMLEEALTRCENYYFSTAKQNHWQAYFLKDLLPCMSGNKAPSNSNIVEKLDLPSAQDVAEKLRQVRGRVQNLLDEVVAETVDDPDDMSAEVQRIRQLLGL